MSTENTLKMIRQRQIDNASDMVLVGDTYMSETEPVAQAELRRRKKREIAKQKHEAAEICSEGSRKGMMWNGLVMGTVYAAFDHWVNKSGLSFGAIWQTAAPVFAATYYLMGDVVGYINGHQKSGAFESHKKDAKRRTYLGVPLIEKTPLDESIEKTRSTITRLGFWSAAAVVLFNHYGDTHILPQKPIKQPEEKKAAYIAPAAPKNAYVIG